MRWHGCPSDGGEVVEQVAKLCRRLKVGQMVLAGKFVDCGVSDVLPHVVERRSVGGYCAVALADDQVDMTCLSRYHFRRRRRVERAEFGVQRSAQATRDRPTVRIGTKNLDMRSGEAGDLPIDDLDAATPARRLRCALQVRQCMAPERLHHRLVGDHLEWGDRWWSAGIGRSLVASKVIKPL